MPESIQSFVYEFKVVLRQVSPMIWRRLLVRGDSTIADLHYSLQIALGWSDSHLQVISKRMVKKQQMRWSRRGAHLSLQVRTRELNGEFRSTFDRWYPGLNRECGQYQHVA